MSFDFLNPNLYQMTPYGLIFLLASLIVVVLGGFVSMNGAPKQRLSFALSCVLLFIWLFATFLVYSVTRESLAESYIRLIYFGVALISPALCLYASVWLDLYTKHKLKIIAGFILAGIFHGIIAWTPWIFKGVKQYYWGYHSQLTPLGGLAFLVFFLGYMVFFFKILWEGFRKEQTRRLKKQVRNVGIVFAVAYLGASDFLPCYGLAVFPLGGLTITFAFCFLGYTIVRYRLFDIETVIHKTLMWVVTSVAAVFPFGCIYYFSHHKLIQMPPLAMSLILSVVAVLFYAYFRALQPILSKIFQRRQADLIEKLEAFSKELIQLRDTRDLLQGYARLIRRSIYSESLGVFFFQEDRNAYVPAIAKRMHGTDPIPADHLFLQWLHQQNRVVSTRLVLGDPGVEAFRTDAETLFKGLKSEIMIPFVVGRKLIGIGVVGRKTNLTRYSSEDIRFLARLKNSVSIAFSNSLQFENINSLYKQVQVQNDRLKELDRLKSEFLANTSHELRTPLNGIMGLVESILDGADGDVNDQQRKHLEMILTSGTSLKELINNLLELSTIESGQEGLHKKYFNMGNVVDSVFALLSGLAAKKGIQFIKNIPGDLEDVYGDPEKIQRVLLNLIGNAIKFTDEGEVKIQAKSCDGGVSVEISDTGIGISEEGQKVMFDRFRQADGSTTRQYEGTGLGLSIAQEIVRRHGGKIEVESCPGEGSAFRFNLPTKKSAEDDSNKPRSKKETRADESLDVDAQTEVSEATRDEEFEQAVAGAGECILVVDDIDVNREVVRTRLEMYGYHVQEAVDGKDALEKVAQEKPDLIILDLMMPRMSGYQFCKEMREDPATRDIPIIILTAKTAMGDKVYGLNIGANDYIAKPFDKEELLARVGVLLRIRQMTQELKKWNKELEFRVDERTEELVKTQEQLIQAEKLATLGTLAGGVAHEINNPLTAVLTSAQMMKMSMNPEDACSIALIEEGAKRCQAIVQKLMKYSRHSPSDTPYETVSLNEVIEDAVSMIGDTIRNENVEIELDLKKDLAPLEGIPMELEQVVTNFLINARDAILSEKKGGTICVMTRDVEGGVEVIFKDDGCGIEKSDISKIFDPFFTTKDVGRGTGLGLSVSLGIIKKFRGVVNVESEVGKGSTFSITFPCKTRSKSK